MPEEIFGNNYCFLNLMKLQMEAEAVILNVPPGTSDTNRGEEWGAISCADLAGWQNSKQKF
jgi:hypothetical protein